MKKSILRSITGILLIICLATTLAPAQASSPRVGNQAAPLAAATFSVSVDSSAKTGIAGSIVSYTFTVTNNTATDLPVTISSPVSVSGWDPAPSADTSSLTVPASGTATFAVNVPIPSAATAGQNDIQRVTISDGTDDETVSVTTTVKATTVGGRPVLMVAAYYLNSGKIAAGNDFELAVKLKNTGGDTARNIVISYDGGTSFYPKNSGGISSVSAIAAGDSKTTKQSFTGAADLAWTDIATIKATVSYTDSAGTAYTDTFTLTFDVQTGNSGGYYATATLAAANEPQLVITGYKIDVDLLQPGTVFNLSLDVKNMGKSDAQAVSIVMGGGGTSGNTDSGTPAAGGVSGAGGELTNFAPLDSANVLYLGNVASGATVSVKSRLIVNVSTEPGVYTMKFSFVYSDSKGNRVVDDQMITLLVYSLPQIAVDFYRDPGVFYVGTPATLPIQVTNLGKKSNVLGNMKVTADGEDITNNVSLVGTLDPGGYYTLDAEITPSKPGPMDIIITINYNDDFNQARTIEQKITIDVQPAMEFTPEPGVEGADNGGMSGMPVEPAAETFWHKLGRFIKGLLGLDSALENQSVTPVQTTPEVPSGFKPKG
jgi:hypothetical protein